ncbi:methyltransferase domain-containing protein [uncultured Methylobacterium sp.]|uniref:class I SAM-dependent methyltransferase n=1 Tax=uncultured Methylobacterium sp. TaxID=157278 RepID=UPI0025866AE5|nr:methyltransferase domain-containing protein [uncultured Methylobacterium sp.]
MDEAHRLQQVKDRVWFYEFDLPDGSRTTSNIPADILLIHTFRRDKLIEVINRFVPDSHELTAFDLASHEGYYSVELARHFRAVRGFEIRDSSREAAELMIDVLGLDNVSYAKADLQQMPHDPDKTADFVLLYGLLYHMEDPIHLLRLASQMARRHILIETQIFPYDVSGRIEDGSFANLRPVEGVFALTTDYAEQREGGSTDIALVPSLNALLFLMRTFGFVDIEVLPAGGGDYEQFRRGTRVIVYGRKP